MFSIRNKHVLIEPYELRQCQYTYTANIFGNLKLENYQLVSPSNSLSPFFAIFDITKTILVRYFHAPHNVLKSVIKVF